jgi:transposase InsO family protein
VGEQPLALEPSHRCDERHLAELAQVDAAELIWLRDWESADELRVAVATWLDHYHHHRPHHALNWQTPIERRAERLGVLARAA